MADSKPGFLSRMFGLDKKPPTPEEIRAANEQMARKKVSGTIGNRDAAMQRASDPRYTAPDDAGRPMDPIAGSTMKKGGKVKRFAKGGGVELRGKTKGRVR